MRDAQQRNVVKAGQLIAEIKYEYEAKQGEDVFGQLIDPPPSENFDVKINNGIIEKEPGKYYAEFDGMPNIAMRKISLSKMLSHQGDVNLAFGNIYFEGKAKILGSIEQGAIVEIKGDLEVIGLVRSGGVKVDGNLIVKGSISSGETETIKVRGDLVADFIEKSRIEVGGNIKVKRSILNSYVASGLNIYATSKDGIVAGGNVLALGSVKTNNLGFPKGAVTKVSAGVDWKSMKSVTVKTARLEKLRAGQDRVRSSLREILRKKDAQMTAKHKRLKDELQVKITRLRELLDKTEEQIAVANSNVKYNSESTIRIKGHLALNCKLQVGTKIVPVLDEIAGVVVVGKKQRGTHIIPIEQLPDDEEENNDAA